MAKYSIGLDYGTNSCRAVLLDIDSGNSVATAVYAYPSGELGILTDTADPHVARQNPQDYLDGCTTIIREVLAEAKQDIAGFSVEQVVGIGLDTTGSTVIPVNQAGTPLAFDSKFKENLNAYVWLWKDHTSFEEAAQITELAKSIRPQYLAKCGGVYSSEWWWSKILHLKNIDAEVYQAAYSFVEHCDWLTAELAGNTNPKELVRSICAAGHKAMYSEEWGGLPDKEFLSQLDPSLADLRDRLYDSAVASNKLAGKLSVEWSERLGLPEGIAIAVGAFDCHMGAVGSGVKPGTLVKVLGTSTCDITVAPAGAPDIAGVCGMVDSSVLPDFIGVEAGQSAVGDLFLWLVNRLVPDSYGADSSEKFASMGKKIAMMAPGESGLLALDWNNGNRTVLTDTRLSGLLLGQTLHTEAHEIYRAYIEATAFGALKIIDRIESYGVDINQVVCTGGLSLKNPTLMQIYADVTGKEMRVSAHEQTCALGAAIFAAVSAEQAELFALQEKVVAFTDDVYLPNSDAQKVYQRLYTLYSDIHDSFGVEDHNTSLFYVMKELIEMRENVRKSV